MNEDNDISNCIFVAAIICVTLLLIASCEEMAIRIRVDSKPAQTTP